jgi:hypothetical protein
MRLAVRGPYFMPLVRVYTDLWNSRHAGFLTTIAILLRSAHPKVRPASAIAIDRHQNLALELVIIFLDVTPVDWKLPLGFDWSAAAQIAKEAQGFS